MKVLMIYSKHEYTTARFIENSLRRSPDAQMLCVGVNGTDIQTPDKITLSELFTKIPDMPELVLVMEGHTPMEIYGIEKSPIPTVYYGIDTHMHKEISFAEANRYKFVFFAQKKGVEDFKAETGHKNTFWLPCSAEQMIHRPFDVKEINDIAFIGGVDMLKAHKQRRDYLKKLNENFKLFMGRAMGLWMSYCYAKAKMVFNCSVKGDLNMRVFEALACKKLLITDKLPDETGVDELFIEGTDYISYKDEKELIDKVKYYLDHKEERLKIAESGYAKVLKGHTYDARVKEMLCQIQKNQ